MKSDDDSAEILGELIAHRKSTGLTTDTVAQRMHCTRPAVSMLETSARRGVAVTLPRLLRYAAAIGVELHVVPIEPTK